MKGKRLLILSFVRPTHGFFIEKRRITWRFSQLYVFQALKTRKIEKVTKKVNKFEIHLFVFNHGLHRLYGFTRIIGGDEHEF